MPQPFFCLSYLDDLASSTDPQSAGAAAATAAVVADSVEPLLAHRARVRPLGPGHHAREAERVRTRGSEHAGRKPPQ